MPEFTAFLQRLRHDLGKKYSVAQEQIVLSPGRVHVLIRRRGTPDTLGVSMETRWLASLEIDVARDEARVEYKHLTVLIRRFFDGPYGLAQPEFSWPGTQESREALRRALDPRLRKRA